MKTDLKIALVLLLCSWSLHAQLESAHWYFGVNAGLNFNQGVPLPLLDGVLNTIEGCEAISDAQGNLLFYTDGTTVWNRNHLPMPNGEDLLGSFSSAQSALIVPKIDDPNIYYVFTSDVVQAYFGGGSGNGLNYSVVDMSLEFGLGDVTTKNVNLLPQSSEKMTAVSAFDGSGYWLIAHHIDQFFAFKVDASGVNLNPTVSTIGPAITDFNNKRGNIKSSPDGTKIAVAYTIFEPQYSGLAYLFDFDTNTGQLTNEQLLSDAYVFYSVEFSADSSKLYASGKGVDSSVNATTNIVLLQYDLESASIPATEYLVHTYPNVSISDLSGTLQIGIDRKIYHAVPNSKLSVIRLPNESGLNCDFREFETDLGGRSARFGLPPFVQSFFESIIRVENLCVDSITEFYIETDETINAISWNFGDPLSGNNSSTALNPTHVFTGPGIYTLTIDVDFANRPPKTFIEFVEISEIPMVPPTITLSQCDIDGNDDGISVFNLNQITEEFGFGNGDLVVNYFLTFNDAQSNLNPIEPIGYQNLINDQVIYARVFENAECYVIIAVILNVNAASDLGIHDTIDICVEDISETVLIGHEQVHEALEADFPGSEVEIYYNINDAHLDLNSIQEDFIIENTDAIALYFRVENSNYCDYIGSVLLNVLAAPVAEDQTIVFCHGTEIILDAGSGYHHYLWSTGATTQSITIEVPGTYWVEISNGLGCTSSFEFEVSESLDFEITEIEIRDFQVQNSVYIQIDNTDGLVE
ncbi:MAG: PKD domain-containing protein, partial [Flavobacteriaceae bacterium]|nr:PKD domain-containing protein [Flavobacteriaceae bacterium]